MKNRKISLAIFIAMALCSVTTAWGAGGQPARPLRVHMGQVMFHYPPLKAVVVFGGREEDPAAASRPWKWNGREWQAFAGQAPELKYWNAMAFDSKRNRLVVFGGKDKNQKGYSDFWEWDGDKWQAMATKALPPGRSHFAMAFDESRGRIVLFGGHDGDVFLGDTWEWDGREWRQAAAPGPAPRCLHTMTYDPTRKRVLLVGGSGDPKNTIVFSDVWEWDGERWSEIKVRNPFKISFHAAAFDYATGGLVVSGGFAVSHQPMSGAWRLRGDEWLKLEKDLPMALEAQQMAWDSERRQLVLFGGWSVKDGKLAASDMTWVWDGKEWTGFNGIRDQVAK